MNKDQYCLPNWLKHQIQPSVDPTTIQDYVEVYFHLSNLRPQTKKKVRTIINRIVKVENLKLAEIDRNKKKELLGQLKKLGYAYNTVAKTFKVLQTLCIHANDNGHRVHPDSLSIAKGMKYQKSPIVYLTEMEISKINQTEFRGNLQIAKDWLIISCLTGQRMGDLFTFTKHQIVEQNGMNFLSLTQRKTTKPVLIPIVPPVEVILKRYKGHFPPTITDNPASNEVIYNRLLKKVAKQAGLTSIVEANIRNGDRYEISNVPKWKAVSSHIGRRSFASNHYGKIPTPLLMSVTGHATERQFLEYIGKPQHHNAIEAGRQLRNYYLNKI